MPKIFRSAETGGFLDGQLIFEVEIPTQDFEDQDYENFKILGTALQGAAIGAFFIHLALRIALSLSLQHIWSLVNSLQIIVSFPLVALTFPRQMLSFTSLFNELSNFEFFPHELVNNFVFNFEENSWAVYQ